MPYLRLVGNIGEICKFFMIIIRELQIEDAENFLNLLNKTDTETTFLLYENDERKTTVEEQRKTYREETVDCTVNMMISRDGGSTWTRKFKIDRVFEVHPHGVGW